MTKLTIRLDFDSGSSIGPGKVRLLEAIEATGSIRRAAEEVGMSFRQAWLLLKAVEEMFDGPVVGSLRGGAKGGGSALTDLGRLIVASYRQLERTAAVAARGEVDALEARARRVPAGRSKPVRSRMARKSPRTT